MGSASASPTFVSQQPPVTAGSVTSVSQQPSVPAGSVVPIPKQELGTLLRINKTLANCQSKSLRIAFAKYTACLEAVQLYEHIVAEGKWPSQYEKVTVPDIRKLFVSKSVWHAQYVPCFQNITNYGEMLAWLEYAPSDGDSNDHAMDVDAPNDEAVWGMKKAIYHFVDLKKWLEMKQKEAQRGKGKGKKAVNNSNPKKK